MPRGKHVKLIIGVDGSCSVDAVNFTGPSCQTAAQEVAVVLGDDPSYLTGCDTCPAGSISWDDEYHYDVSPDTDPAGPSLGLHRVLRGGSWNYHIIYCRSAFRHWFMPEYRCPQSGFRVAAE